MSLGRLVIFDVLRSLDQIEGKLIKGADFVPFIEQHRGPGAMRHVIVSGIERK